MATQQLMFNILGNSDGADRAFDGVVGSADRMASGLAGQGQAAAKNLFGPLLAAAAGGSIATALGNGLMSGIENDSLSRKLAGQLALTEPQSKAAGEIAGRVYAGAYGDSMETVNEAVGAVHSSLAQLGSGGDIEGLTKKALNLASTFGVDVNEATSTAGTLLKNGLVPDANAAMDLITSGMQRVPAAMRGEIFPTFSEYSKHFAALGIDGDTAMGMIVASSADGAIGMDKMGDALKEFTIRATDGSKSTEGAMEAIGLNAHDMSLALLAGGDTAETAMGQIVSGLQNMDDPAAQAQAAIALFGTPLEDLGTDKIPNFLGMVDPMGDAFDKTAGAADNLDATLSGGAANAWTSFQRAAEQSLGAIGTAALPVLTPILEGLKEWAPVIGPVVIALGALAGIMAVVNAVMALNPITWIIVGIVALIAALVLLIANWDAVVAWISGVWGGFVGWLQGVTDGFVAWWNAVWAGVGAWISGVWSGFVGWISGIWSGFVGWILGIVGGLVGWWNAVWGAVGAFLGSVWSGMVGFVTGIWSGYIGWLMGIVSGLIGWWNGAWSGVASFIGGIWSNIVSGASGMISGLLGFFQGLPGQIMGILSGAGSWLFQTGKNIVQGLLDGIRYLGSTIGGFFLGLLPDWIVGPFKAALGIASPSKVFRGFGRNIGEGLLLGVGDMSGAIDRGMSSLVDVPALAGAAGSLGGAPGGFGGVPGGGGGVGDKLDQLIDLLRSQRPVTVNPAPGMDEATVGRMTAEQLMWSGGVR